MANMLFIFKESLKFSLKKFCVRNFFKYIDDIRFMHVGQTNGKSKKDENGEMNTLHNIINKSFGNDVSGVVIHSIGANIFIN